MAIETERLTARRFRKDDAPFVLATLNDPPYRANIGDRGVRTIADAEAFIRDRYDAMHERYGFCLFRVALRANDEAIGTAGFVRRDWLDAPDLGFAFLAEHVGRGYGYEIARALIAARPDLRPLLAFSKPGNGASVGLLAKLGFVDAGPIAIPLGGDEGRLYRLDVGDAVNAGAA